MKNKSYGFSIVYKYYFKNTVQTKKYILTTILISLILIVGIFIALNVISSKNEKDNEASEPIEKIYICNESSYNVPLYDRFASLSDDTEISSIEFEIIDTDAATFIENTNEDFLLLIQHETDGICSLELIVSDDNKVTVSEAEKCLDSLSNYFKMFLCTMNGLTEKEMVQIMVPCVLNTVGFGEQTDQIKQLVTFIADLIIIIIMYMIVILYGQQICNSITIEKTSKLVEQLLMSVTPQSLLFGKILSIVSASLLQFMIWIISIFIGLFGGDKITMLLYNRDSSTLSIISGYISEWFSGQSISPIRIVLAIVALLLGYAFYLILSGVAGSLVTKPEESSSVTMVYMFPLIISYLILIISLSSSMGSLPTAYVLIPFTGSMCAPMAILLGQVSLTIGIISILINLICIFLLIYAAGHIYKAFIFLNDRKPSFKDILLALKS